MISLEEIPELNFVKSLVSLIGMLVCVFMCVCVYVRTRTHCYVQLFATPWTIALQASLSMDSSRW